MFVERLCLGLRGRGHQLHVVAPADGGHGGRDERLGIAVERVRYARADRETLAYRGTMTRAARSPAGWLTFAALIRAMGGAALTEARALGADIMHAHWWLPGGIAARRARRAGGPPYVLTVHGTDVALLRRSRLARAIGRRVFADASACTAVSTYLAGEVKRLTRQEATVQPMPALLSTAPSPGSGGNGVVSVGRLSKQKRLDLLLRAMARLPPERAVPVVIVGDGPERTTLEAQARQLGIAERTRFTGAVPPEQVAPLIAGGDVFAFPAAAEGFGLAAAEALTLGVPVVALSDGGGVLDIMSEDAGVVAAPTADALASAIVDLLERPDARARATAAGAALAVRLQPEHAAAAFETVLRGALDGGS